MALLIGIGEYRDPSWHRLRFATKDANDLASVFRDPKQGKFDHVLAYTSPLETTRALILEAFAKLRQFNLQKEDTLFVYISAHGTLARDETHQLQRYLVTSDTKSSEIPQSSLSIATLKSLFSLFPSQRKVLLLATCHSGAGKSRFSPVMTAELRTIKGAFFHKPFEESSKATIFLAVCDFGETARESEELKNDIYTHFFLRALLRRYDANGDGAVTVSEAHDYARELTWLHTKGQQRPYIESDILGTDPIVLVGEKKSQGRPILFAYEPRFHGVEVRINGAAKGAFPKGITLTKGVQRVTLVAADHKTILFEGSVRFQDGERLPAESLFERKEYRFALALQGGYQAFFDGSSADHLSRPLPLFGLAFKLHRPFPISLDLRLEIAFARDSHTLREQDNRPQTVTEVNVGLSALYLFTFHWFSCYLGPRLSVIYLERQSDLHKHINDFFYSFQPGLVLGAEFRWLSRFSCFLEGRINYTYVTTEDGPPRHQGSYEFLSGVYVHF